MKNISFHNTDTSVIARYDDKIYFDFNPSAYKDIEVTQDVITIMNSDYTTYQLDKTIEDCNNVFYYAVMFESKPVLKHLLTLDFNPDDYYLEAIILAIKFDNKEMFCLLTDALQDYDFPNWFVKESYQSSCNQSINLLLDELFNNRIEDFDDEYKNHINRWINRI